MLHRVVPLNIPLRVEVYGRIVPTGKGSEMPSSNRLYSALICFPLIAVLTACGQAEKADEAAEAFVEAAAGGDVSALGELLDAGADVNARNKKGVTPLIVGAYQGRTEIIEALLEAEADTDAATKDGRTGLIMAANYGHKEIVEALLKAGADIHARTDRGETALSVARAEGRTKIVELLKEAGAAE